MRLILTLLVLLTPFIAIADVAPNPVADEIFSSVMSPYCAGRLLRDCPSSKAAELKDKMRSDLTAGKSKEMVLEEFYANYGEEYRASPKGSGFGLLGWIAPGLFVLLGGLLIYNWISSNRASSGAEGLPASTEPRPVSANLTDEMKARIEKELMS